MRPPVLFLLFCVGHAVSQHNQPYHLTTPVPILKQINKHNEDGSYSYGFEAADGSYKIESKYPTGEVYGKYGFVDDTGNVREVEYGASRRGFEPIGAGINVPPPTLTDNSIAGANEPEDDGQYREDPSIYHTDPRFTNGERYEKVPNFKQKPIVYNPPQRIAPESLIYDRSRYNAPVNYQRPTAVSSQLQPEYRPQYQPHYHGQQLRSAYVSPVVPAGSQGHAATNIEVNTGLASYTVNYK